MLFRSLTDLENILSGRQVKIRTNRSWMAYAGIIIIIVIVSLFVFKNKKTVYLSRNTWRKRESKFRKLQ